MPDEDAGRDDDVGRDDVGRDDVGREPVVPSGGSARPGGGRRARVPLLMHTAVSGVAATAVGWAVAGGQGLARAGAGARVGAGVWAVLWAVLTAGAVVQLRRATAARARTDERRAREAVSTARGLLYMATAVAGVPLLLLGALLAVFAALAASLPG
jgi:small-conductance mechanosensitive channel